MRLVQFVLYTAIAVAVALPGSAVAEDPDAGGEITDRATPPVAAAAQTSTKCSAVFARLRAAPSVSVWWTTNYFANGIRFMGVTALELRLREGDLVGQGRRAQISPATGSDATDILERRPGPIREINLKLKAGDLVGEGKRTRRTAAAHTVTESSTLRIRPDNTIVFHDIYGPYQMTCLRHPTAPFSWPIYGYAMVQSGDSVEILNFHLRNGHPPGLQLYQ